MSEIKIKARVPPAFIQCTQDTTWKSTPKDWLYGVWRMTHTSQEYYHQKTKNLTIQYGPVLNGTWPCANQELVTLNPDSQPERVYTAFGIDIPIDGLDDAWLVKCTGNLSQISDFVAFLAWGQDISGVDWVAMYSTPLPGVTTGLPAQICIMTRDVAGLNPDTVRSIKQALLELPDPALKSLVEEMKILVHEGASVGKVDCGYDVLQNTDSLTRF